MFRRVRNPENCFGHVTVPKGFIKRLLTHYFNDIYLCEHPKSLKTAFGSDTGLWTDLGALYVVVQVVPEGVDEVDGVVSGIGIGVTGEQDCKHQNSAPNISIK